MINIDPNIWGKSAWTYFFCIALSYPEYPTKEEQTNMKTYFNLVGKLLPCENCRLNYFKHLANYPLNDYILSNRNNLLTWLTNIHNETMVLNGKNRLSVDDVIDKYINKKPINISSILFIICMIIIIVLLICFIKFK